MDKIQNFNLEDFKLEIYQFLLNHKTDDNYFKLTLNTEHTIFSHCFGIFILNSINKLNDFNNYFTQWSDFIITEILKDKDDLNFRFNKAKMQKLCFSLSALNLLKTQTTKEINILILDILNYDIKLYLQKIGFYENRSQSANFCMFYSVLLIYSIDYLNIDNKHILNDFMQLQLNKSDVNGFFNNNKFNHLAFQNFYHQFEIFEFLNLNVPNIENGIKKIKSLHNFNNFRNAPYCGSSGCYDFDALSIVITSKNIDFNYLTDFFNYIIDQRNNDFGFSESRDIRPISCSFFLKGIIHILFSNNIYILKERLIYFFNYSRCKYNKLETHWTNKPRDWNESNLWDTWLKIQIIFKILIVLGKIESNEIKFINFPGMGYFKSNL